jgi:RNA exonuclease 1
VYVPSFNLFLYITIQVLIHSSGVTPKAGADGLGTENAENPSGAAEKADQSDTSHPPATPDNNVLFSAVTNLNAQLTALHAALPARTAFILFSGHSDPRAMSALAARRAEYQASQHQSGSSAVGTSGGGNANTVRWSTADERALEEAVVRARMGLLFVGVKT